MDITVSASVLELWTYMFATKSLKPRKLVRFNNDIIIINIVHLEVLR